MTDSMVDPKDALKDIYLILQVRIQSGYFIVFCVNTSAAELFVNTTQFPASNDEKYIYLGKLKLSENKLFDNQSFTANFFIDAGDILFGLKIAWKSI